MLKEGVQPQPVVDYEALLARQGKGQHTVANTALLPADDQRGPQMTSFNQFIPLSRKAQWQGTEISLVLLEDPWVPAAALRSYSVCSEESVLPSRAPHGIKHWG